MQHSSLLIVGDFNAAHIGWGYLTSTPKGKDLWNQAQQHRLTLTTDHSYPTRIGTSTTRDTTPDLTFVRNIPQWQWQNLNETLGSDHCIIQSQIQAGPAKPVGKKCRLTNWDRFRAYRDQNAPAHIDILDEWTSTLIGDISAVTEEVPESAGLGVVDSHLLHLWQARSSIHNRWRNQRLNKKLRIRVAELDQQIATYAQKLTSQQWNQICDDMRGQLSLSRTWQLLRYLLEPATCKSAQREKLLRLAHQFQGSNDDLLQALQKTYIASHPSKVHPDYTGPETPTMDAPILEAEVRAAALQLNAKSSPGADQITNKALQNLDDTSIKAITEYMNKCWEQSVLPQQWKHARIIFIPKAGKTLCLENLRPISLTSCLGKLMEHVVLNRLRNFVEDNNLLPPTLIGFRPGLSTQDAMLRIRHDVLDRISAAGTKAILGLDLTKAFDNITHTAILQSLHQLGVGPRTYSYVRDFLQNRTAEINFGDLRSNTIHLGSRGTPQGSVLSPFLFNLAMRGLPPLLSQIPDLKHSIYADDVTLWVSKGNDAHIEETLQQAVQIVEDYVRPRGLECSPQKSELLLLREQRGSRGARSPQSKITILVGGNPIPEVPTIRILGLYIQNKGRNAETLNRLEKATLQTIRLINRITNRHAGMKEAETLRLVQAFVLSRITYSLPYLRLTQADKSRVEILLRRVYKVALGLPIRTSTERLLALGLNNTLEEMVEAHLTAQYERLSRTTAGRYTLSEAGIRYTPTITPKTNISPVQRTHLKIFPIPRNMNPTHHTERRVERAKALHTRFATNNKAAYVDAAEIQGRHAFSVAVINYVGQTISGVSIKTTNPEEAEEAAIALAIANTPNAFIISDSKSAIRNYIKGRISPLANKILAQNTNYRTIQIHWAPAHSSLPGNEAAHQQARAFASRAHGPAQVGTENEETEEFGWSTRDRMVTYNEITQYYKLGRLIYPPAHESLTKRQELIWRKLQTGSFPTPILYSYIFPTTFTPQCKLCRAPRADLFHILWGCPNIRNRGSPQGLQITTMQQWEATLLSSNPEEQAWVTERAEAAAREQGLQAD